MNEQAGYEVGGIGTRIFLGSDRLLRPIWRAVLFVMVGVLVASLAQGAAMGLAGRLPPYAGLILGYALLNAIFLLQTWAFLSALDRRNFRTFGLWSYRGSLREISVGIASGAAFIVIVVIPLLALGLLRYQRLAEPQHDAWLGLGIAAFLLFLAAAFEEIIFRGYVFQRLVDSIGMAGAVALLGGLFGAAHLNNPSATVLSTANIVLAGVLLSVAYLKTRALWLPIGLHWAWNFTMACLLSLPVSGLRIDDLLGMRATLFHVEISGADWLSGGAFGPEGSVILTVLAVVFIVGMWRSPKIVPSAAMQEVLEYKEEKDGWSDSQV